MCKAAAKNSPGPPYSPLYSWKWTAKVGQEKCNQHTCIFCEQVKALKLLQKNLQGLPTPPLLSGTGVASSDGNQIIMPLDCLVNHLCKNDNYVFGFQLFLTNQVTMSLSKSVNELL